LNAKKMLGIFDARFPRRPRRALERLVGVDAVGARVKKWQPCWALRS
jgi:hypothetical protein